MIASLFVAALLSLFDWAAPVSFATDREVSVAGPTDYGVAALSEAVEDWGFTPALYGNADIVLRFEEPNYPGAPAEAATHEVPCVIRVAPDIPPNHDLDDAWRAFWRDLLRHEVGHCLGLGHTENWVPSAMGHNANRPITPLDRAVMALLYH